MVLVATPEDAKTLLDAGAPIQSVNLGGLHYRAGRIQILKGISLDDQDVKALKALSAKGLLLEARALPLDEPVDMVLYVQRWQDEREALGRTAPVNKVHFILGVHNHQPIGNFDFVFEKAYANAYLPFLEAMERHPGVHWTMHATGILWEWLERHHADYIDRVSEQVKQGRLEILTGGYYEPILPALPDADKAGQIQKLTRYIRQRFKTKPRGMWLAERVWEPHLTKVLADNGVEYTLVDDAHFLSTGMTMDQMCGSYLSEEQGATVLMLPIREDLRYAIPFKDPGETIDILRQYASPSGHKALVMFDDGEKFGLWPDTHKYVYEEGWLENFLTVLESNKDWIVTSRISDYLNAHVPQARVYLPTASYSEMGEWTLPCAAQEVLMDLEKHIPAEEKEAAKRFVRGGFWRNFLTKYEESNNVHKKMLRVSEKVHQAVESLGAAGKSRIGKAQKMLDPLWAGQCNCAYWHGVFGGLYLPHLRQALYRELLSAELQADKVLHGDKIQVVQEDFDKDGRLEVLVEAPEQNLYFAPSSGGSLFEWDLRKQGINLQNTLTRRAEGYHRQLLDFVSHQGAPDSGAVKTIHDRVRVKEPGLDKRLFTDWYRRTSLLGPFPASRYEDRQFLSLPIRRTGRLHQVGLSAGRGRRHVSADPALASRRRLDERSEKHGVRRENAFDSRPQGLAGGLPHSKRAWRRLPALVRQ